MPRGGQLKVERNLALLGPLGVDGRGRAAAARASRSRRAWLRAPSGRSERAAELVALHPGVSGFGAIKQWAPERYAGVARRLRESAARAASSPGDRASASSPTRSRPPPRARRSLAPETGSLLELAALYEVCDAVVGGDTGPIHLAAALGVPVVGLYGPKDPAIYAPWDGLRGRAATTVWKHVHCSPCRLRRCGNVICMPAIEVEDVTGALARALAATHVEPALRAAAGAEARG